MPVAPGAARSAAERGAQGALRRWCASGGLDRFTWGWESFLKALKAFVEGRPIK